MRPLRKYWKGFTYLKGFPKSNQNCLSPRAIRIEADGLFVNLIQPGKRISVRDCLHQGGLWVCLWGIVLVVLINVGRSSLKVGGTIPWFGALDRVSREKANY